MNPCLWAKQQGYQMLTARLSSSFFCAVTDLLDTRLAKKFQKLRPIVLLDAERDPIVKAVHLHILIIVPRVDFRHKETVAEVALDIFHAVRKILGAFDCIDTKSMGMCRHGT